MQVDACAFSHDAMLILQQKVMAKTKMLGVVIETLPTSNVRISQYQSMEDHHLFRWLQVGEAKIEGDPEILVSLGSDDPGIFANNLKSEFYHLYLILRNKFNLTDVDALSTLAKVNERGRIYRFHSRN